MKKEINMEKLIWKEITGKKIRTFQLADEPYVIYVIPTRHDEYVIVKDDAYEMETGETEMLKGDEVKDKYGINLNADNDKCAITLSRREVLVYEVHSHWFASLASFKWGQYLMGKYFARKVRRKYNRYLTSLEERKRVVNENLK
jgi:hypothetical protein|tara:strand:- start:5465 stop:5896 length:432 start_codon:yes stop_codon:yes gene_type:complete